MCTYECVCVRVVCGMRRLWVRAPRANGSWLHCALRAGEQAVRASVTHLVATGQERGGFVCLVGDCENSLKGAEEERGRGDGEITPFPLGWSSLLLTCYWITMECQLWELAGKWWVYYGREEDLFDINSTFALRELYNYRACKVWWNIHLFPDRNLFSDWTRRFQSVIFLSVWEATVTATWFCDIFSRDKSNIIILLGFLIIFISTL